MNDPMTNGPVIQNGSIDPGPAPQSPYPPTKVVLLAFGIGLVLTGVGYLAGVIGASWAVVIALILVLWSIGFVSYRRSKDAIIDTRVVMRSWTGPGSP